MLAAGSSRRAGEINKLLHEVDGEPMVRRVVRTVLEAVVEPCVVVLGHEAERVREVLGELPIAPVVNEDHAEGIGASIRCGMATMSATEVDAALIVLGDMPFVRVEDLRALVAAYRASNPPRIVAPEAGHGAARRLGNPVLWPRHTFESLVRLRGDRGARRLLMASPDAVLRVSVDHPGVLRDIDTIGGSGLHSPPQSS
ncbi:MAG: nucleotidyltransferase family protein [Myxococcota bacterium]